MLCLCLYILTISVKPTIKCLRRIFRTGSTVVAVTDQSEVSFSIPQVSCPCHRNQVLLALSAQLSYSRTTEFR